MNLKIAKFYYFEGITNVSISFWINDIVDLTYSADYSVNLLETNKLLNILGFSSKHIYWKLNMSNKVK